jgi:hypothetical protein
MLMISNTVSFIRMNAQRKVNLQVMTEECKLQVCVKNVYVVCNNNNLHMYFIVFSKQVFSLCIQLLLSRRAKHHLTNFSK